MKSLHFALTALLLSFSTTLFAADPIKIGMITTLSTKAGYLGEDVRDGFNLAVKLHDGMLGGVPVEVLVEDDERKPAKGKQVADRMMKKDGVQIMTGIIFSNVAVATIPAITREDVLYLSPNAGPSDLAGKKCDKNYFNVAWQNDNLHEAMGQFVNDNGNKKVYILAPNYPAGKDALTGFKRYYKGEIAGETYTKLGQSDYAAELATIRSTNPDGVFFFLPGGMGINFVKQYAQADLNKTVPLFGPAFSFDARLLQAVGDAAVGVRNSSQWNHDLDNPANKAFVEAFVKEYGRLPTLYASQGYDTAQLIDSALKATGGDLADKDAFRAALKKADFESVRGNFKFANNQHPIQDIYVREVVKDEQGNFVNKTVKKVFTDHVDAYAAECGLQ